MCYKIEITEVPGDDLVEVYLEGKKVICGGSIDHSYNYERGITMDVHLLNMSKPPLSKDEIAGIAGEDLDNHDVIFRAKNGRFYKHKREGD